MSSAGTLAAPVPGPAAPLPASEATVGNVFRVERRKLTAQFSTRVVALICVVGPFAFAAVLDAQSGSPNDALFGVWTHQTGYALSLVILGFAGAWGFPIIAGVLAGDMFSSEDRYQTWKTVLTRSATRNQLFAGKVLAAMLFSAGAVVLAAVATIVAGVLLVGNVGLVSLDGVLFSPGRSLVLVLAAWVYSILPMLGFTSLALLFSVASRSGIVGVIGPALVALVSQLIDLIGKGVWAHTLLIGSAFDGWHGLFLTKPFYGQLAVCALVSVVWIVASLAVTWLILARRDFAGVPVGRRTSWVVPVRAVAITAALIALLAFASNWGPTKITAARLRASLTPTFNSLTLYQQELLGRQVPAGARLNILPYCSRRGAAPVGPGDWTCTLDVFIPQPGAVPFTQTPVTYEISMQSNGCYKAESPPSFVGNQTMRDAKGATVVNPLFVIYGCFNPL